MGAYVTFSNDDMSVNSESDWGAMLLSTKHSQAEVKTEYIDIPAGNGTIDVSTVLTDGIPVFNDRTLEYKFYIPLDPREWATWETRVRNKLDGKKVQIVESRDSLYYWIGRCTIGELSSSGAGAEFTVSCTVEPLKYGIASEYYGSVYISNRSHVFNIAKSGYNSTNLTLSLGGGTTNIISVSIEYKGIVYDIDVPSGETLIALEQFVFECDGTNNTEPVTVTISGYCYATGIMIRRGYL